MEVRCLLVLPVEEVSIGRVYAPGERLPLHCTLMHWFRPRNADTFMDIRIAIEQLTNEVSLGDIILVSQRPDLFGPADDVPVHVLHRDENLMLLHTRIFTVLAKANSLPEELRWAGAGYAPHVTDTEKKFRPSSTHVPREIILVERDIDNYKQATQRFPFRR